MTTTMSAVDRALGYLAAEGRPVDLAWTRAACFGRPQEPALAALAAYQNDDGGIGHGLEVDIAAPVGNPFAARLALQVHLAVGTPADHPTLIRLVGWLEANQGDDGDWRFAPSVYEHDLAPWFAGWTFPSLNPSLCLGGLLGRLGLGSDRLHARCRALFAAKANLDELASGGFYAVLPYAEAVPWLSGLADRDVYLAALTERIARDLRAGAYEDAEHAFAHIGPPDGPVARRLPSDLLAAALERLRGEQEADGGWPTPYAPAWRSWGTATSAATLAAFGSG
ncbi:MAG: hypothetical protein AVDCRST_MAG49-4219 [uncultured Thermomicrobiales bacterium]|uniref:Squalene cyclase C-terminal domain-containing protein n=1 Tax=uncultured Thermomicrobiales bacterium TaxID=1645740 RepID=A0A6J4VD75_9BACT|nr:MAG: hypothetical protein AVDCRST_MAG49-4219 [uncultured Thermomicrobiales bacterium]